MTGGDHLTRLFASIANRRIDGGCDDCHAYQIVTERLPGVWQLVTSHDDTCPTLASIEDGSARRAEA